MPHALRQSENREPIGFVLERVGSELKDLTCIAQDIENIVSALIEREKDREIIQTFIVEVQQLDLLVQRISGVRSFLLGLAEKADVGWKVNPEMRAAVLSLDEQHSWLVNGVRRIKDDANSADDLIFSS